MKANNFDDIIKTLTQIESKYSVEKWTIDNIHIWPLIRMKNKMLLSGEVLQIKPVKTISFKYARKVLKAKFQCFFAKLADFTKEVKISKADILFLSDGRSFAKINSKWYNKLCDPIVELFILKGFSSIILDLNHNFFFPRYSPSKYIQNKIDNVIILALVRTKLVKPRFINENWVDFEDFSKDNFVRENLIYIPTKEEIRQRIFKITKLKVFYLKKLQVIKPKLCFVVNYYGDNQMAFILACKELNIPSIDIQHGMQENLNSSYCNWSKIPANGFVQMPNYFLVWSLEEKKLIDNWSNGINKVLVSGNLFSQLWKDNTSDLVIDLDKQFEKLKIFKNKKSVLLTLNVSDDNSILSETWDTVRRTQNEFNWFIRVHPSMIRQIEKIKNNIFKKGIRQFEINISSVIPLHTLLRNVDAHITGTSSCIVEAVEYGVKSIITLERGMSLYNNFVESREAFLAISTDDIIQTLNILINQKKVIPDNLGQQAKYRDNAIDELIKNNFS